MSLELPGWVVDAFYFLGLPWPAIDEDELRGWANDLREFATEITELSRLSHDAVHGLKDSNQAGVVKTMAEHWDHHHALMMAMREPIHVFASALDVAAEAVVVQKGVVIGQAIALAAEVAATQGEALFTLGLAEAEVPAEVALTKMAVKYALQELELKIIGYLINKAAKEVSDHVNRTVAEMLMGSTQVVFEAISLKLDYESMQRVADTAKKHKNRAETDSIRAHRRAASRKIETSERGGRWHVVQVLEQALLSIAEDIFKQLPGALHAVLEDTEKDLKKAIAKGKEADSDLARDAPKSQNPSQPGVNSPNAADPLSGESVRGSGSDLPDSKDVLDAVKNSNPKISGRTYGSDDGHYYADRVLVGGRADGETVLAGHGYLESGSGAVTVPPGTSISFYVHDGELIPGLNGVAVEGGSYPGGPVQTFHSGDEIPNYTLAPPASSGGGGFSVYENSTTVAARTPLSDLLKPDMGNVHWAACREHKQ